MLSLRICVAFFLFLATLMWLAGGPCAGGRLSLDPTLERDSRVRPVASAGGLGRERGLDDYPFPVDID
jgi:hypothetical protein